MMSSPISSMLTGEPYKNAESFQLRDLPSSSVKIFEHIALNTKFYQTMLDPRILPGFQNRMCGELKKISLEELSSSHEDPTINSDLLASYQSYAIFGLIIQWIQEDFKYSAHYMAEQLVHIINYHPNLILTKHTT